MNRKGLPADHAVSFGLRISELHGLKWSDVYWLGKTPPHRAWRGEADLPITWPHFADHLALITSQAAHIAGAKRSVNGGDPVVKGRVLELRGRRRAAGMLTFRCI